jgi:uncharacterized protein
VNIPLFPLSTVLFPQGLLPLRVFEVRYTDMVRDCLRTGTPFGVVNLGRSAASAAPDDDTPEQGDEHPLIGTLATVVDFDMLEPGVLMIAAHGGQRFKVLSTDTQSNGLIRAHVALLPEDPCVPLPEAHNKAGQLLEQILAELKKQHAEALKAGNKPFCFPVLEPFLCEDAGWVAHRFAEFMPLQRRRKQWLLEQTDPLVCMDWIGAFLKDKDVI